MKISLFTIAFLGALLTSGCGNDSSSALGDAPSRAAAAPETAAPSSEGGESPAGAQSSQTAAIGPEAARPSASSSGPSVQPLPGVGRHTPSEARFVTNDALDVSLLGRALQGPWRDVVQQLRADALADQDATELTRLYEPYISNSLGSDRGMQLKDFACGVTLCAGTITSRDQPAYASWREMLINSDSSPLYSFIDSEVEGNLNYEYRLAFSADETAPALLGQD